MPRCVCAVFDSDIDYINRFSGYLKKKTNLPFDFCYFTEREALEDFILRNGADLLLFSGSEDMPADSADIPQLSGEYKEQADYALLSVFEKHCRVALLKEPGAAEGSCAVINKYQSMEGIISEITQLLEDGQSRRDFVDFAASGIETIGIYSFGHSDKAVKFALGFLLGGSSQTRALYINLDRFSGLSERFDEPPAQTFSDVIYYFMTGSGKLRSSVCRAKGRIGFADVFAGPDDLEDLDILGDENWPAFLGTLSGILEADRIVLDFGEGFRNIIKAFDLCGRVYLIASSGSDSARLDELGRYLEASHRTDLFEKIMEVDTDRI